MFCIVLSIGLFDYSKASKFESSTCIIVPILKVLRLKCQRASSFFGSLPALNKSVLGLSNLSEARKTSMILKLEGHFNLAFILQVDKSFINPQTILTLRFIGVRRSN